MLKKWFTIPALALGIALITGSLLWALPAPLSKPKEPRPSSSAPHGGMPPMGMMMNDPLRSDLTTTLKLTPVQARKVKAIQDATLKTMDAHGKKTIAIQQQIATAMKADKPNLTTVDKLIAQSGQEQIVIRQTAATGIVNIKGLLTKAQRAKFPESPIFSAHFGMRGSGGMGGMHGRMPMGEHPPTPPRHK